jgi:hypothetical protein
MRGLRPVMSIRIERESDRQRDWRSPAASRSAWSAREDVRCEGVCPRASLASESAAAIVRCTTRRRSPCAKEVTGPSVVRSVRVSVRTNRSGYADSLMPALSSGLVPSRVASRRLRSCSTVPVLGASCAAARGAAARSESAWASDRTRRVATGRHGRCSRTYARRQCVSSRSLGLLLAGTEVAASESGHHSGRGSSPT